MENHENELRKAVQELADEEGISFSDAVKISIKALRYEVQRRKSFTGSAASDSKTLASGGMGIPVVGGD